MMQAQRSFKVEVLSTDDKSAIVAIYRDGTLEPEVFHMTSRDTMDKLSPLSKEWQHRETIEITLGGRS